MADLVASTRAGDTVIINSDGSLEVVISPSSEYHLTADRTGIRHRTWIGTRSDLAHQTVPGIYYTRN
jgi:hypothetical protein